MRARAQALSLQLSFSRARARGANARAQRKRCTADQTDVTPLPAHSALFGENKAPVRAEGEAQTVKNVPKSGLDASCAAAVKLPQIWLQTDHKNVLCPCSAGQPLVLGDGGRPLICSVTLNTQMTTKPPGGLSPGHFRPLLASQMHAAPRSSSR